MNELSKNLMCISIRNGVELWVEAERVQILQRMLETMVGHKFINFDNQSINTADVVGIFSAETMEDMKRGKNGQWRCRTGTWHDKYEKCTCVPLKDKKLIETREEAIRNCKLGCTGGYRMEKNTAVMCECVKPYIQQSL